MDLQLAGTTVLVTGAGQGLGRAIGMAFAAEGAHVAFHYHASGQGAEKAAAEASELGVRAIAVGGDTRDAADVASIVERTESGLGPIGVLVNNSAVTRKQKFLESTPEDWAPQVDVTVTGTLQLTHAVAKRMADKGGGSIVNLMGDSGRVGESGLLVTATTRSTTVGLTRSHKIRSNAVSLALVRTDNFDAHAGGDAEDERMKRVLAMYPLRRFGHPDDITPMVLLLASPLSSWTTGQVVSVNGGYAMP